jgi:hypothetical protein
MIVKKMFQKRSEGGLRLDVVEGWYLFGLIPLYVKYTNIH